MSTVQFCTTKRPQLCKFEVTVCKHVVLGVKRKPFWKLPCLTCKNDKASAKEGVGLYILSIYIYTANQATCSFLALNSTTVIMLMYLIHKNT